MGQTKVHSSNIGVPNTSDLITQTNQRLQPLGSPRGEYRHSEGNLGQPYNNHFNYIDRTAISKTSDLDELRAQYQSAGEQWLHGVGKFGVRALGSFVGTLVAPVDMVSSLGTTGELYNGPIATFFDTIYEKAEEWMPNYYTKDEQENTRVFTANFMADKALKNAGFTVGTIAAMLATGGLTAGLIGKGMRMFGRASKQISQISSKVAMANASGFGDDALAVSKELATGGKLTTQSLDKINGIANARLLNKINKGYQMATATLFEAGAETREGLKSIDKGLKSIGIMPGTPEYEHKMDEAGKEIFNTNLAILSLSNAVMYSQLLNRASMRALRADRFLTNNARLMSKESIDAISKSGLSVPNKLGINLPNIGVNIPALQVGKIGMKSDKVIKAEKVLTKGWNVGKNVLTEGFYEEGGQFATHKAAEHKALEDKLPFGNYIENLKRVWSDLGIYKEGKESVILGAMTGGMVSMISGIKGSITGEDQKAEARERETALNYLNRLHTMFDHSDQSYETNSMRSFLNYYEDKFKNGKLMYESLQMSSDALEKVESEVTELINLTMGDATADQKKAAIANLITQLGGTRVAQMSNLVDMAESFGMVNSMDVLYENIDGMLNMPDERFSALIGLPSGQTVDTSDKIEIIEDLKDHVKKAEYINNQLNNIKESLHPDALYEQDEEGNITSNLLSKLKYSLATVAAYDLEYDDLIKDFDAVMKSPDEGGITISFASVAAHADSNNMSLLDAYSEIKKSIEKSKSSTITEGHAPKENSLELEKFDSRFTKGALLLVGIKDVLDASNKALNTKLELEASLLDNKARIKENQRIKRETVDKYIDMHLAAASSVEEVNAIENHLRAFNADPTVYKTKVDTKRKQVTTLQEMKERYEAMLKDGSKERNAEEIKNLSKNINKVTKKLESGKLDSFELGYLDNLFQARNKVDFSKLNKKEEAKANKKDSKLKNIFKKKDETSDKKDDVDKASDKLKIVEPNDKTKNAFKSVLDGFTSSTDAMSKLENLKYEDDTTGEICDPGTKKPITKAANGLATPFTLGGKWGIIKEFKGRSHAHGGIDISIGNGKISMSGTNANIKAANGVLITGRDYIKDFNDTSTDIPPIETTVAKEDKSKGNYKDIPRYNSREKGSYYYSGTKGTPEQKELYLNELVKSGVLKPSNLTEGFNTMNLNIAELSDENFEHLYEYEMLRDWYNSKGAKDRYIKAGGNIEKWDDYKSKLLNNLDNVHFKKLKYNNLDQYIDRYNGKARVISDNKMNASSDIIDNSGGWTTAHEATHGIMPEEIPIIKTKIDTILTEGADDIKKGIYSDKHMEYLLRSDEITARINQMRFDMYLDPNKPLTEERLNRYKKNVMSKGSPLNRPLLDILPNKILLRLFNEIVDNSNNNSNRTDNLT